ncbi:MAG: M12 family metallo-peptidase [Planctomycetota bacterium]
MAALLALVLAASIAPTDQGSPEPHFGFGAPQAVAFPMTTYQGHPTLAARCYTPNGAEIAQLGALRSYRCVSMSGLDLPGFGPVQLELTRIDDVAPATISQNGSPPGATGNPTPTDMSLWYGSVPPLAGSRACLAFSQVGVWGWVRTDQRLFQLASFPQGGSWSAFHTLIVDDRDKNRLAGAPCGDVLGAPPQLPHDYAACLAGLSAPVWHEECPDTAVDHLRLCRLAVETDHQLYLRFGDIAAAEVYVRFVIGAVAQQLRLAARVVLRLEYLGLHSTPQDPWLVPDLPSGATSSPCCIDAVYEFQHRWGTQDLAGRLPRFTLGPGLGLAPVAADVNHFMSGANMGCGVAIGKLGVDVDAFSLSCVMGALNFDRSNTVHPTTGQILDEPVFSPFWQVYLAGHEIGHNLGAPHTQGIRYDVNGTPTDPTDDVPIDRCSTTPDGRAPDCTTTGFAQATLMSYCTGCAPGFLRNLRIGYHPQIAKCLRTQVATLPDFEDVHFVTDLGNAHAPPGQTAPQLHFSGHSPGLDRVQLTCTGVPVHTWRALLVSASGDYQPFGGAVIVPRPDLLWDGQPVNMPLDVPIPPTLPNGLLVYFQQVFALGTDLYATNALAMELIR